MCVHGPRAQDLSVLLTVFIEQVVPVHRTGLCSSSHTPVSQDSRSRVDLWVSGALFFYFEVSVLRCSAYLDIICLCQFWLLSFVGWPQGSLYNFF